METERKNCLICGFPDVLVLLLDSHNIYQYHCPSCKDYYVTRSFISKISSLKLNEYLPLMNAASPDNKIMCFDYDGVNGIRIFYDDEIES
ncbi:TPA: hypothetical protein G8577_003713 [Salmonella enterica]|uniref:Uncharacterized protein n=1 Tax=Salmonella enterica TaxID=28901 RepID=A0A764WHJ7_SALER|nr:hypothetical protein [Salmonella enterica]HDI1197105.1 hypothetical protein [Salmonella enterica]